MLFPKMLYLCCTKIKKPVTFYRNRLIFSSGEQDRTADLRVMNPKDTNIS
ncbi:hypothetical protein Mucpa_5721 [Mucilaginibacter paludis DSM 18603]|uniref:Uncharacterized protein n=1 Tax=Mucilaginibacter paludis DSM 18603 TaxID=714943 RepID=H1Y3M1_9SPHI|nr:hypothetical protein Mucpa_5721 [Mucilaginibacter paludis DSM 18603]